MSDGAPDGRPWQPPSWTRGPVPDAVLAATIFFGVAAWGRADLDALGWTFAAVSSLLLCARTRYPTAVAGCTLVLCLLYYPISSVDGPIWPAFVVALYTVAVQAQLLIAIVLVAVALIAFAYDGRGTGTPQLADAAPFLLAGWLVAAVAIGAVVHNRQALLEEAERRAWDLERRRAEELQLHATRERLRIARELHDVLGHSISVVSVHASAALHRSSSRPDGAEAALRIIKDASREALRDLRATLGMLREGEEAVQTPGVQAGLAQLRALIARATTADRRVVLDATRWPAVVPSETSFAVLRIVQESLTNVERHSTATEVSVRLAQVDDRVFLSVHDNGAPVPGATPGTGAHSGSGVEGMRQRARTFGGTLSAGLSCHGGFLVEAELPLRAGRSESALPATSPDPTHRT